MNDSDAGLLATARLELRSVDGAPSRTDAPSPFEDWGPRDPDAEPRHLERWVIELVTRDGRREGVGDLSAHPVWYGPNAGSKAMNIGITIASEHRGRGIGSAAQRLLAELLHGRGVVRVEASTDITNIAEQRALANAGFILEGVARAAQARADGRHDLQVWSHIA